VTANGCESISVSLGSHEAFGVPGGDAREPGSKSLKPADCGLSSVKLIGSMVDGFSIAARPAAGWTGALKRH
jgi:hypothetical protein